MAGFVEVKGPDGQILRFPDSMSTEEIKGVMAKKFGGPAAPAASAMPEPPPGFVMDPRTGGMTSPELLAQHVNPNMAESALAGGGKGLTFGSDDEVAGAGAALSAAMNGRDPGAAYDFGKAQQEAIDLAAAQNHPFLYYPGLVGGAILGSLGIAGAGKAAATKLPGVAGRLVGALTGGTVMPTVGGRIAQGAAVAGSQGALYGALDAPTGERGKGAAFGGAAGAILGAGIPALVAALRGGTAAARTAIPGVANGEVAAALTNIARRAKVNPADIQAGIAQAAREGQPEWTIADQMGYEGQRALSGYARTVGSGRQAIHEALTRRQADAADRVAGMVQSQFGAPTAAEETAARIAARKTAADASYGAARAAGGRVDLTDVIKGIDDKIGPLQSGDVALGEIDTVLKRFRDRLTPSKATPGQNSWLSDYAAVEKVSNDIGDAASAAFRQGHDRLGAALADLNRQIDLALEKSSGMHLAANAEYSAASKGIDAVKSGAELARPQRAQDAANRIAGMTPDQKAAAAVGYADSKLRPLDSLPTGSRANIGEKFTSSKDQAIIDALAKDPALFTRQMQRESVMNKTLTEALGGSATAQNIEDSAAAGRAAIEIGQNVAMGNAGAAAKQVISIMTSLAQGQNEATRQAIASALMSRDWNAAIAAGAPILKARGVTDAAIAELATAAAKLTAATTQGQ